MNNSRTKGFTLIEIIVAIGLFSIVSFIAITAVLSITAASAHSQRTRAVSDTMGFIFEDIVRNIQVSTAYEELSGGGIRAVYGEDIQNTAGQELEYFLAEDNIVYKRSGDNTVALNTADRVVVDSLIFTVLGGDRVRIQARAHFAGEEDQKIHLQTTVLKRVQ